MRKLVGNVTTEEKNEILSLFERRNGLNELVKILTPDNDALYENSLKIWERRVRNSKVGGVECMRNIFGKI